MPDGAPRLTFSVIRHRKPPSEAFGLSGRRSPGGDRIDPEKEREPEGSRWKMTLDMWPGTEALERELGHCSSSGANVLELRFSAGAGSGSLRVAPAGPELALAGGHAFTRRGATPLLRRSSGSAPRASRLVPRPSDRPTGQHRRTLRKRRAVLASLAAAARPFAERWRRDPTGAVDDRR